MVVTLIVIGVLTWALKEAAEDVIRTVRGNPPPAPRRGFRGYLDDRWQALADRHERARTGDLMTAYTARQQRRHLAREKALAFAGYKTSEEIARAAADHRRRLGLIDRGVDPDTMQTLDPVHETEPEDTSPVADTLPDSPPEPADPPAEPGVEINGRRYTSAEVWINPEYFPPESSHDPQPGIDDYYPPEPGPKDEPWSPYATDNLKGNTMSTVTTGEINGPADVKAFHDALAEVFSGIATLADTFTARVTELANGAHDLTATLTATENAAAGMRALGMDEAAHAAGSLMEAQGQVHDALLALAQAHRDAAGALTDQANVAQVHLGMILAAYEAQLAVQDARTGAGRGNLARDEYLDRD